MNKIPLPPVSQIGIVVRDMDESIKNLSKFMGIGEWRIDEATFEESDLSAGKPCKIKLAFAEVGNLEIELIQTIEGRPLYQEFLENKGEGIHHIGIDVPDIYSKLDEFEKQGIEVIHGGSRGQNHFAYLDSEKISGIIIELLQRPKKGVPDRQA
jgi:hypothetical protein